LASCRAGAHVKAFPPAESHETSQAERLSRLMEVSRALNSQLDLRNIIRQILQAAIQVIPAADSGTLYIYEADAERLVVYDAVGLGPEMYGVELRPGEGMTGRAFATRLPYLYADETAVLRHMSDGGDENLRKYAAATGGLSPPKSAMTAPMIYKGDPVGVLIVDNLRQPGIFQPFDLDVLDSLAQSAALALVNARLFEAEREARGKVEIVNRELTLQRDQLQRQLSVRSFIGEMVRSDFSVQSAASRLAEICRSHVWVLDPFYLVTASEPRVPRNAIHELKGPNKELMLRELQLTMRTRAIRQVSLETGTNLLIAPVCPGPEVDGFVVVQLPGRLPDSVDETAIDSASLVIAMRHLRDRAQDESEVRSRGNMLQQLLEGESPRAAAALKHLRPPLCLVVGRIQNVQGPDSLEQPDDAAVGHLQSIVRASEPRAVVTIFRHHVVILFSLWDGRDVSALVKSMNSLDERFREMDAGWETAFAISEPFEDLGLVSVAFHEGRLSIAARRQLGLTARVFPVSGLRAYRLLLRTALDDDVLEICRQTLAAVRKHEAERGGALLSTYRCYVANSGSLKATARVLGVHPHTVQYRLERLQALSGLNLKRFEDRLTLDLATRILELVEE
jgi:sugar diacid utilization regulator